MSSSQGEERERAKIMLDLGGRKQREVEAKFGRKGWVDSGRRRAEKPMS